MHPMQPLFPLEDGTRVIRLMEAIPDSNEEGFMFTGSEIHLSEDCELFDQPMFAPAKNEGVAALTPHVFQTLVKLIRESEHGY